MKLEDLVVTKFDTSNVELVENLPYVLENRENKERQIGALKSCKPDGLAFCTWSGCFIITPADAKKYNIYKADLTDDQVFPANQQTIKEGFLNQDLNGSVTSTTNEENCSPAGTIVCHRIIDYMNQKCDECHTPGIEKFYKVDTESGVTVIKQFLYKVALTKDNDLVQYAIMLPASESDKREYMDSGWKIHPMFYNKDNDCYMNSVVLGKKHVMDFTHREKDSITIQILSGLQLLYLIEFGLNQNPKLGCSMYAGIKYDDGCIVISNAYADETDHLVIDGEIESILIYSDYGYISRFLYKNENYDWLFLPKETTDKPTLTDSFFAGPSRNRKNIILWGDSDSNAGIFRLWINSTSTTDDDCIIPWEFGE